MYRHDNSDEFKAFVTALEKGHRCEVDEAMHSYFLEVLPPIFMYRSVTLNDGTFVLADFGFAEGQGVPVAAFWHVGDKFFAQLTKLRTRS